MDDSPDRNAAGRDASDGAVATADALIDAAEDHFARDGFERASLRAVMRAAGADPGAVHYHFGGRPALAAAVLDRILAPLNARRLALLAEARAAAGSDPIPVDGLVEALVRPDIEAATALADRGAGRSRLAGAIYLNPAAFVTERVEASFAPVAERYLPEMVRALPAVAPEVMAWRVRWVVFGTLGALLSDPDEPFRHPADQLVARLVTDFAAVLAAPPDETDNDA